MAMGIEAPKLVMNKYSPSQISAISRLFSSNIVRDLSRHGRSPTFARLAKEIIDSSFSEATRNVFNFFDATFDILKKVECRHEYIYKSAITQKELLGRHSLNTASMLNEFRVGDCKADVAILNGTATVYEIKSERDSLLRLERQIETYKGFFASVNVIAGDNHIDDVRSIVSDDIGILKLSNRYQISKIREAKDQPERTSPEVIFESIRIQEAKRILALLDISVPDVPNTAMHATLRELFVALNPTKTHKAMVQVLKQTRSSTPLLVLVERLPSSLHSVALSVPLRRIDHDRLLSAVNTPLRIALQWD